MLFRQTIIVALLLGAVPIPSLAAPAQGDERTKLCQKATLGVSIVHLSDLLPREAPDALRARAAEIALGSAPQPGLARMISGMEIRSRLIDAPDLLERLKIPDWIVIQRSCRLLSNSELLQAIRLRLGAQATPDSAKWDPSDLQLSTPVYVTLDDPGLEVTRIELDPLRRQTRFRLWTSKEPPILPFWVTLAHDVKVPTLVARHDVPAGQRTSDGQSLVTASDLASPEARAPVQRGQAGTRSTIAPVVMIEPGRPAKLVVEGAHYRISTTVIPLQAGVLGQQIRVREVDSQHILSAEVVGRGELKAAP
jgi:flagella basal body P-ring formation protein FlgA